MYATIYLDGELDNLYSDLRVALAELNKAGYALTLINNVTGEVIKRNW